MQRDRIKTHPWWQKIKQHLAVTPVVIRVSAVGIVLVVVIFLGYRFNWAWTGFGSFSPPNNNSSFQRGKTLWDWLQLLIIPLVLAIGGYLFNLTVSRNEREATAKRDQNEHDIALDNQQEATLQEYINKMAELLLDKNLRESAVGDEVLKVARARTLTVLPRLNASRKGSVLKFLFEANLLDRDKHIVDLSGADLTYTDLHSADLSDAYLRGAYLSVMHTAFLHGHEINMNKVNLSDANLRKANLSGVSLCKADLSRASLHQADLSYANLSDADLRGADLTGANLTGTDLTRADLRNVSLLGTSLNFANLNDANLTEAYLNGADLSDADLSGADLTEADLSNIELLRLSETNVAPEQLAQAKSLEGAILPDGSTHP